MTNILTLNQSPDTLSDKSIKAIAAEEDTSDDLSMKNSVLQVTANTENTKIIAIEQLIGEVSVELVEDVNNDWIMETNSMSLYITITRTY